MTEIFRNDRSTDMLVRTPTVAETRGSRMPPQRRMRTFVVPTLWRKFTAELVFRMERQARRFLPNRPDGVRRAACDGNRQGG